ncbi:MAG TPA: hypothetical protein VF735_05135 [Pyrinomonadaceae bacterium]|jgi:hypothetical protein
MSDERSTKLHLLLPSLLIIVFCFVTGNAQSDEKSSVLKNCIDLFGSPVDVEKNLFEINSLYLVEVRFDSQGSLMELAFFPKSDLGEKYPAWKQPQKFIYLSRAEYEDVLRLMDKIRPKGEPIKSLTNATVHSFTVDFLDQYEHAFLNHRDVLDSGNGLPNGVRRGSLYFFRQVEGKVKKKGLDRFLMGDREAYYYQVSIGKFDYFVRKEDYLKLRIKRMAKLSAAGPIEGLCIANDCSSLRQHNNSSNRGANNIAFNRETWLY